MPDFYKLFTDLSQKLQPVSLKSLLWYLSLQVIGLKLLNLFWTISANLATFSYYKQLKKLI